MLLFLASLLLFPGEVKFTKWQLSLTPWWWIVTSNAIDKFKKSEAVKETV